MKDGTILESDPLRSPLCQAAVEGPGQAVWTDGCQVKGQTPLGSLGTSVRSGLHGPTAPGPPQGPQLETESEKLPGRQPAGRSLTPVNGTTDQMEAR